MSHPRIKRTRVAPDAAELALLTDAQLQKEYDRLMGEWMVRSNSGQRQTWRRFNQMDSFHLELVRRRYGPAAVVAQKAELSNVMEILQRES